MGRFRLHKNLNPNFLKFHLSQKMKYFHLFFVFFKIKKYTTYCELLRIIKIPISI